MFIYFNEIYKISNLIFTSVSFPHLLISLYCKFMLQISHYLHSVLESYCAEFFSLGFVFRFILPGIHSPKILTLIHFLLALYCHLSEYFRESVLEALFPEFFYDGKCFPFAFTCEYLFSWVLVIWVTLSST